MQLSAEDQEYVLHAFVAQGLALGPAVEDFRSMARQEQQRGNSTTALTLLLELKHATMNDVQRVLLEREVARAGPSRSTMIAYGGAAAAAVVILIGALIYTGGRKRGPRPGLDGRTTSEEGGSSTEVPVTTAAGDAEREQRFREAEAEKKRKAEAVVAAAEARKQAAADAARQAEAAAARERAARDERAARVAAHGKKLDLLEDCLKAFRQVDDLVRRGDFPAARKGYAEVSARLDAPDLGAVRADFSRHAKEALALEDLLRTLVDRIKAGKLEHVNITVAAGLTGELVEADLQGFRARVEKAIVGKPWSEITPEQMLDLYDRLGLEGRDRYPLGLYALLHGVAREVDRQFAKCVEEDPASDADVKWRLGWQSGFATLRDRWGIPTGTAESAPTGGTADPGPGGSKPPAGGGPKTSPAGTVAQTGESVALKFAPAKGTRWNVTQSLTIERTVKDLKGLAAKDAPPEVGVLQYDLAFVDEVVASGEPTTVRRAYLKAHSTLGTRAGDHPLAGSILVFPELERKGVMPNLSQGTLDTKTLADLARFPADPLILLLPTRPAKPGDQWPIQGEWVTKLHRAVAVGRVSVQALGGNRILDKITDAEDDISRLANYAMTATLQSVAGGIATVELAGGGASGEPGGVSLYQAEIAATLQFDVEHGMPVSLVWREKTTEQVAKIVEVVISWDLRRTYTQGQ